MLDLIVKLAESIVGPKPGVELLLLASCGILGWAYWQEKKKNVAINQERLEEMKETTQALTEALVESTNTIEKFSTSNEALKKAFEVLTHAVGNKER